MESWLWLVPIIQINAIICWFVVHDIAAPGTEILIFGIRYTKRTKRDAKQ